MERNLKILKCHMSSLRIIHEPRYLVEFGEIGVILNERAGVDVFFGCKSKPMVANKMRSRKSR